MLKQPLLSRMFKSSGDTGTPTTEKPITESLPEKSPGKSPEKSSEKSSESAIATQAAADIDRLEKSLESKSKQPSDKEALAKKLFNRKSNHKKATHKKTTHQKRTQPAADTKGKRKRVSRATIVKAAVACGVLATAGGFAFVRLAPETLKGWLSPSARTVPLSLPNDPIAESVVSTGDLFLTNQILYRKLEAIAGVSLAAPKSPASLNAATPNAANGNKPEGNLSATDKSADGKDAGSKDIASKPTEPNPDEQVIAAAPPAPAAAPVDFSGTTIDSVLEMRVSLARDVPAIGFATSGSGIITDLDGNVLKEISAEQGITAEISGGITVDGEIMPSAFWVYPEDGGYVAVGDSWYRGRLLVALRERGLIAVNYVLLGDYLYSVVGTEMSPGWSIESLKAQAVAARSYALTHNIHTASEEYFDLDNTQRFQAYKGISREADTTQAAVQATAGEFISHEGGIVESLYAASQAIVDDAHKGSGMSQLGAKDLAEQGYSYQEILSHYYPGTALGRLETDAE